MHLAEGDKFLLILMNIWERRISTDKWYPLFNSILQSLTEYFNFYYSSEEDSRPGNMWIIDPSAANIEESKLSMNEKESLNDLSCDDSLKVKFQSSLSRPRFWLSVKNEYSSLSEKAMKIFDPIFNNTFMREDIFICHSN